MLFLPSLMIAQTTCADCIPIVPMDIPQDTIYLDSIPPATVGVYYEEVVSFRMPKTTDPVAVLDPSIPAGIDINNVTIDALVNIPLGLTWEANQDSYNPGENPDGCITICGTPIVPGDYQVDVTVSATVLIITQSTSFPSYMTVRPATITTDGFALTNNTGCGEVEVSFENKVPSNGNDGFSYVWSFGNGMTSNMENPPNQVYDEPGTYEVTYNATVDTVGHILSRITVTAVGCSDVNIPFFNSPEPDLIVRVFDAAGTEIYRNDPLQDTPPPIVADPGLVLEEGSNYSIEVWDEDSGIDGSDELCGTINFNTQSNGSFTSGDLSLEIIIINPITEVTSIGEVTVYAIPEMPVFQDANDLVLCEGETANFEVTNYTEGLVWYQDSVALMEETMATFSTQFPGVYWVEYTDQFGCAATSTPITVSILNAPEPILFTNVNNELTLFNPEDINDDITIEWYFNGEQLDWVDPIDYCVTESGIYALVTTDNNTGCTSMFANDVIFNPDYNCGIGVGVDDLATTHIEVYPNPTSNNITINSAENITSVRVWDASGRAMVTYTANNTSNFVMDLSALQSGLYLLEIANEETITWSRVVKQ